ncbi:Uncharacterised protein [Klebsiella pneumoniae]|nr:Uncharacterised protein [Klebsiella pneumoniae]
MAYMFSSAASMIEDRPLCISSSYSIIPAENSILYFFPEVLLYSEISFFNDVINSSASSYVDSGNRIPNSSPPNLATILFVLLCSSNTVAKVQRALFPSECPKLSLIGLKLSKSIMITQNLVFFFLAFLNVSSVIITNERLLHIPVNASVVASLIILNSSSTISAKSRSKENSILVNILGFVSMIHIVPATSPSGSFTGYPA